jgi:hypothetical protein
MVLYAPRPQRSAAIHPHPVGVFEDNDLLLRLAALSRSLESSPSRVSGPIDADDLALEYARLVDSERWDL